MSRIRNTWVGYLDRTYEQFKASVFPKLATKVPELNDHTDSAVLTEMLGIWFGLHENLGYYVDRRAEETFLSTCKQFSSGVKIARLFDYRVRGTTAATADLTFSLDGPAPSPVTIPEGTEVRTAEGVPFRTVALATIGIGQTQTTVSARQWVPYSNEALGDTDGSAGQSFTLRAGVVDGSITVTVNGLLWEPVDTFAYSNSTDAHFVAGLNEAGEMEVRLGDGTSASLPAPGLPVEATYYTSMGTGGNVGPGTINDLVGAVSVPSGLSIEVSNVAAAAGGANADNLAALQKRIPLTVRTLRRAVTKEDYAAVALLAPGVAKTGVFYDCGKYVDVYVAPLGGGVASAALLSDVEDFMDGYKMITTQVQARAAGEVQVRIEMDVRALPNFANADVEANCLAEILDYFNIDNQDIGGAVRIGDIYQRVEKEENGTDYSTLRLLTTVPYARPVGTTSSVLSWVPTVQPASAATVRWEVKVTDTNAPGEFQLLRDGVFLGVFPMGTAIAQPEVVFTVNSGGAYSVGDTWEFYTYPVGQDVELAELSVPVTDASLITLNVTGGY